MSSKERAPVASDFAELRQTVSSFIAYVQRSLGGEEIEDGACVDLRDITAKLDAMVADAKALRIQNDTLHGVFKILHTNNDALRARVTELEARLTAPVASDT